MDTADISHVDKTAQNLNTRQPNSEQQYTPGNLIWWYDQPRGGYGPSHPVRATFVRYNRKTVTIAAQLKNGGTRERRVYLTNIRPRES